MPTTEEDQPIPRRSSPSSDNPTPETTRKLARGEISLLGLVNIVLRHRGPIAVATVGLVAAVVGLTLLGPSRYTARATFAPQSEGSQTPRLAGLASQFGVSVPTGNVSESPQFYADLLLSRRLLEETSVTTFEIESGDGGMRERNLLSLLEIEGPTRARRVSRLVSRLRSEIISVTTDDETGVVTLSVTTPWADLSAQIAERMIELINRFNLERRQTQAEAERKFLESRLSQARTELRAAEDTLEQFLQSNRRYEESPELRFKYQRLQRRVSQHQQVFTSLSQSYEQARIDEVRNTPVITVIDPAQPPAAPDDPGWVPKIVFASLVGSLMGLLWAFGREVLTGVKIEDPDEYAEYASLKESLLMDWRRLIGRVREAVSRSGSDSSG